MTGTCSVDDDEANQRSDSFGVALEGGVQTFPRILVLAEPRPALAQAVMAPLISLSFSSSMFKYRFVDQAVPAMCRNLAAARLSAD
jgi:hypothetical protein